MKSYSEPQASSEWNCDNILTLSKSALQQLMDNKIPLIRIRGFATVDECKKLVHQANLESFNTYQDVFPKIERIGITVFEYDHIGKSHYFEAAQDAALKQQNITSVSFNPLQRFMDRVEVDTGFKTRIAFEPQYGKYHAGLIRKIERGTQLHIDYAPAEQPEWEVSNVTAQLSWNLYLQTPSSTTGKTIIYEKQWQAKDRQYKQYSYGYKSSVISGVPLISFQPVVGDVFIFNTRNYHIVDPSDGYRITFTSAMGLLPNQEIIFWS